MSAFFSELSGTGLIAVEGPEAASFLQAQVTSDVARMTPSQTQYSGYCSPKGRLLATFLVWRCGDDFLLQLPRALSESVRAMLAKYVLRARVKLSSDPQRLFGIWGSGSARALLAFVGQVPERNHEAERSSDLCLTRLPVDRFLALVPEERAKTVRAFLCASAQEHAETAWDALDIEAGVPVITIATQDQYVPQMVNLDLIGGVSYTKGCYPGQEIVARTHHLGRLKQRMYRVVVRGATDVRAADPLFSQAFGSRQASGALLSVATTGPEGHIALAVIQKGSVEAQEVHWKSMGGPTVEFLPLPYAIPA